MKLIPKVHHDHISRSLNAITMILEYLRQYCFNPTTEHNILKIRKFSRYLITLEQCNQEDVVNAIQEAELKIINDLINHSSGMNCIELSLCLLKSQFSNTRKNAELLMESALSKQVRSNGEI